MSLFRCRTCHAVYEDYCPPDDTCIKCKKGTIRIITSQEGETMTAITPILKLHTRPEDGGIHINSFILEYDENYFHLQGGTKDTIHVFTQSIALYVLTINTEHGTVSLNTYMAPEPDALNTVFLHSVAEIENVLGDTWEQMTPLAMTKQLINHLI